jgi:plasmid stabilization system protein ParE
MVRTIRWTETAIEDFNEAARFIHRDSPYYAAAFVKEVRKAARSHCDHSRAFWNCWGDLGALSHGL